MKIAPASPDGTPALPGSRRGKEHPTLAELKLEVIASGGNVDLFDSTVRALGLDRLPGSLAPDQVGAIASAMATGATALAGFNALPELLLSAGSNRAQTALFRECARAAGLDAAQLSEAERAAIDERFEAGLAEAARRNGAVGLSLAQNFISQHLGIIEFDSVPGSTCFSVILPIRESQTLNAPSAGSSYLPYSTHSSYPPTH